MDVKKHETNLQNKNKFFLPYFKLTALTGIAIFTCFTWIAIQNYLNYSLLYEYLSDLGVGDTALIFNTGVILCGTLLLPYFVSQYRKNDFLAQLICFMGIASLLFFICVGVFPLTSHDAHFFVASMFFFTMAATIFFALVQFIKMTFNNKNTSPFSRFLFILISIFAIANTIQYLLMQTPAWQKLAIASIAIWGIEWVFAKANP